MRARVLLLSALFAVLSHVATAQVPTGTITGRVTDTDGAAVPGVTVTATSANLQGSRTVVTSSFGDYVIPVLPPGDYSLTFELSGFQKVVRSVKVAATQSVPLDATLSVAGIAETVTVVADATPLIGTAQVATSVKQDLMATLPSSRTLVASVLMAPNVKATGPNNTNGADGSLTIAGAMSFDSLYLINGVAVTENLRGQPFALFIEDAIQETTVATAGISAEYGRFGGGLVNAITKSGGNRFSGSYRQSFNNDSWRTTTPFHETKLDKTIPTYEYTIGGPVFKDTLWFFTDGRFRKSEESRQTFTTNISYPRIDDEKRYEGKLTYSFANAQTVKGSFLQIKQQITNNNFQNPMDLRSLYNQGQPQDLLSLNYNGVFGNALSLEGQYSQRHFSITGAGAQSRDLIQGTLLVDRSKGGSTFRYWAPTFCGVCDDEARDNQEVLVKANYFLSTDRYGAHGLVFGYDGYNDHRFANNYQSGSDYRILGTSTILQGTTIYPVFLSNNSTIIQWNPITLGSQGSNLRTHSGFVNDAWRVNSALTLNLGLRFDRNVGEDAAKNKVSNSQKFSPRLGATWDPARNGVWTVTASYARYVSGLNTAIAENSPAGNSAFYQWFYQGPAINADASGPLTATDVAIRQVFDWFNANGGTNRTFTAADVPGVNTFIDGSLNSPNAVEYATGFSRTLGNRGSARVDYVYRDFKDMYATRTDLTTGKATNSLGTTFDVNLIGNNSDDLKRRYQGGTVQLTYRVGASHAVGATYTLSRLWGNVDGENATAGPITAQITSFPEYRQARWNLPEGDLFGDQRHRARIWGTYHVPVAPVWGSTDIGVIFGAASGVPYMAIANPGVAVGQIDPRPYVTNPGYALPLGTASTIDYAFFARDEFRTEAQYRTDLSINYNHGVGGGAEVFFHGEVLNLFDQFQLCGCGGTVFNNGGGNDIRQINTAVLTSSTSAAMQPFNPFTETPVRGVNWDLGPNFGKPTSRFAYTTPRTFRFSLGVRF